jgi:TolB-like protein
VASGAGFRVLSDMSEPSRPSLGFVEENQNLAGTSIRCQLNTILASITFQNAERLRRLLRFLVEWTLTGATGSLKEYVIGTEVFDKPDSFDPRSDPIVRVQVRRLRAKLIAYYRSEGTSDPIEILVPEKRYAPLIRTRSPNGKPYRSIAVVPFLSLNENPETRRFCEGVTEEVIHRLTRSNNIRVVASGAPATYLWNAREIGEELNVEIVLKGTVRISGDRVRIATQLIQANNGWYLWSEIYDRAPQNVFAVQEDISRAIVIDLELNHLI